MISSSQQNMLIASILHMFAHDAGWCKCGAIGTLARLRSQASHMTVCDITHVDCLHRRADMASSCTEKRGTHVGMAPRTRELRAHSRPPERSPARPRLRPLAPAGEEPGPGEHRQQARARARRAHRRGGSKPCGPWCAVFSFVAALIEFPGPPGHGDILMSRRGQRWVATECCSQKRIECFIDAMARQRNQTKRPMQRQELESPRGVRSGACGVGHPEGATLPRGSMLWFALSTRVAFARVLDAASGVRQRVAWPASIRSSSLDGWGLRSAARVSHSAKIAGRGPGKTRGGRATGPPPGWVSGSASQGRPHHRHRGRHSGVRAMLQQPKLRVGMLLVFVRALQVSRRPRRGLRGRRKGQEPPPVEHLNAGASSVLLPLHSPSSLCCFSFVVFLVSAPSLSLFLSVARPCLIVRFRVRLVRLHRRAALQKRTPLGLELSTKQRRHLWPAMHPATELGRAQAGSHS